MTWFWTLRVQPDKIQPKNRLGIGQLICSYIFLVPWYNLTIKFQMATYVRTDCYATKEESNLKVIFFAGPVCKTQLMFQTTTSFLLVGIQIWINNLFTDMVKKKTFKLGSSLIVFFPRFTFWPSPRTLKGDDLTIRKMTIQENDILN